MSVNAMHLPYSRVLQQHLFSLLQTCKATRELIQLHAQIIVNGFSQKNYIVGKLLSFCVTSGDLERSHQVFNEIENPSTIIWNQMIRGYARSKTPQKSVQLYNQMEGTNAKPDGFTYSYVLNACSGGQSLLSEGEQLHGKILGNGYCSDVFVQTNLINMYLVAGGKARAEKARGVFDEMTERSVVSWNSMLSGYLKSGDVNEACRVFHDMPERNVVSWTTMIAGCARNGRCKKALALFREMWRARVEVDQVAMVAALSACAELGDLKTGRWIHSFADQNLGLKNNSQFVSLNNALMHMYASCGLIEEAYGVFKEMKRRSTISWTTIIVGYAKQGRGEEALSVFQWMQKVCVEEGVMPDDVTFLGVLCACSHTGMVHEGRRYFKYMKESCGIEPTIEHYGCMVDMLSRAGLLDEAHKLIETMPIKPNDILWGALLGGCRIHKNIELASNVAHELTLVMEPDRAAGYLVLLSNVYAAAKRWADVAGVRKRIVEMGGKKPPGRSWIQVDGVIHDFVAGDWTHKHVSAIYGMLGEITSHAKLESNVQSGVFLAIDREEQTASSSLVGG